MKASDKKFFAPKLRHTKPCKECPWRRTHPAGWLGGYTPAQFVNQVQYDGPPLACHKTDNQDPPSMCAGALIFMKNSCKAARHPSYGDALTKVSKDTVHVFNWPQEFVAYHDDPEGWVKNIKIKYGGATLGRL